MGSPPTMPPNAPNRADPKSYRAAMGSPPSPPMSLIGPAPNPIGFLWGLTCHHGLPEFVPVVAGPIAGPDGDFYGAGEGFGVRQGGVLPG